MPAFLPHFLPLVDRIRAYATPTTLDGRDGYDVRPHKVEVIVRTVTGELGDPDAPAVPLASNTTEILPRPIVEEVSSREIMASGGRYDAQDLRVGPITPAYDGPPAGGYTRAILQPEVTSSVYTGDATSTEVYYRLTGPLAGDYEIIDVRQDEALSYYVVIRLLRRTPRAGG